MNPNSPKLRARIEAARKRSEGHRTGEIKCKPIPEEQIKAVEMGYVYEAALGRYRHRPTIHYFKGEGFKPRTLTLLAKAANLAEKAKAPYLDWVEAQFYWFHKWYKRAPKLYELSGQSGKYPARWRYTEYVKINGKMPTSDKLPLAQVDQSMVDSINQKRLQQLCSAWKCTEVDVLIKFGLSGVFDAVWLQRNSLFRQLKQEGRLR